MREKLDELARLHGEAQKTAWQAGAAREIYAAFPALLEYVRGLERERDQLRAEVAKLSSDLANARAEIDRLNQLDNSAF